MKKWWNLVKKVYVGMVLISYPIVLFYIIKILKKFIEYYSYGC